MEKEELQAAVDAIPYWYHRIELLHGITTPGWAPINPAMYGIPDRMDGETVLDVGAWDGYWTFEALKRGTKHVTVVEDFSDTLGKVHDISRSDRWRTFDLCAKALGYVRTAKYNCIYKWDGSIEDDEVYADWELDRIFCFGLLYHLRNPLKALQNCFDATKSGGFIHVETAILDATCSPFTGKPHDPNGCYAEFYPADEYGSNNSNWWVPTLKCAAAWLQAVGYVDIEGWKLTDEPKSLAECRGFLRARKPS